MNKYEKILIIGSGGREHAVGWKIKQSERCGELYFAPGNGGTSSLGTNVPIEAKNVQALLEYAKNEKIDLTLALPDDPLALGIVDEFNKAGLRIFGPTKAASEVEWSKAFAKNFMAKHNLPTAKFQTFIDFEKAKKYLSEQNFPIVIKASGLALGKGVVISSTREEAEATLYDMMVKKVFGEAGMEVVIEEFIVGPEVSLHSFSDSKTHSMFPIAQDHKKIGEGDSGQNTGGMGTIAPVPFLRSDAGVELEKEIIGPTLAGLRKDGRDFNGVLFPGLILANDGPKILEFNARFGDPETQTYMRLLETDLLDVVDACIDGTLENVEIKWSKKSACTIVLASGGYPLSYEKGKRISGIEEAEADPSVIVFHAGTQIESELLTSGGRVLGVSAVGDTLEQALISAYQAISKIHFDGMYYRRDIGKRALELAQKN
jgi:phosphoribosylamine--glycine ligase